MPLLKTQRVADARAACVTDSLGLGFIMAAYLT